MIPFERRTGLDIVTRYPGKDPGLGGFSSSRVALGKMVEALCVRLKGTPSRQQHWGDGLLAHLVEGGLRPRRHGAARGVDDLVVSPGKSGIRPDPKTRSLHLAEIAGDEVGLCLASRGGLHPQG